MAKIGKDVLFDHTQRYVREVMASSLRQEGFVSRDAEDVHWFRVIDNKVLHAVYFLTPHATVPVELEFGYSCTPLFIPPLSLKGVYMKHMPGYEQVGPRRMILKLHNRIYRMPDAMVHCPADEHTGEDLLARAFLELNTIRTPQACYEMHKQWHSAEMQNGRVLNFSPYLVDEALFWDDQALYPICNDYILLIERLLAKVQEKKTISRADQKLLGQVLALKDVLTGNQRENYLSLLVEREKQTKQWLEKHTAIRFDHTVE